MKRTLLTAGLFALAALTYVPRQRYGYSFIYSPGNTSIAFFQLLVNVVFAALLGAILATIIPKIVTGVRRLPKWVWRWITGIAVIALLCIGGVAWRTFTAAAADRARFDEEFADSQLAYHYPDAAKFTLRSAARDWRLAFRFDEAARVENRIKKMGSNFDPDAFIASHGQSVSTPLPSPDRAAKDLGFVPDPVRQPTPTPEKHISTHPKAGEPNVFDQFDSSTAVPIPRARPVRSPSPR